jgi:anti-sigma B factor antagonist
MSNHDRLDSALVEDRVEFDVAVEHLDDRVVVHVEGELDMASADAFENAVSPVTSAPHVVLDLSGCTFLDSTGMRLIAATVQQAPRVSIVATDPGVRRVLEITAVDTMVVVHASLEEAL